MALSLRRANAVKDALVRDGVPAQAITVIGTRREPACWCRPATACASRRTAASRSSSSKTFQIQTLRERPGSARPFLFCAFRCPRTARFQTPSIET